MKKVRLNPPVAFVINPDRIGFANVFADVTQGERPIQLFRNLHEARTWLDRTRQATLEATEWEACVSTSEHDVQLNRLTRFATRIRCARMR